MKKILRGLISLFLIFYLIMATGVVHMMAGQERCAGMRIEVNDTSATPFVTARELSHELADLPARARGMLLSDIDTDSIRSRLAAFDKIERVRVVRYTDDSIIITVDPMRPVARIFDGPKSYYINRLGKRISTDARYHVDVPVVLGHFGDSAFTPVEILPLLDFVASSPKWNSMVSMVKVDSPSDVLLIPAVRGQVINLGSTANLKDKFARLDRMYTDVIPAKGWSFYDTISVKWSGQVVATRREKSLPDAGYIQAVEEDDVADVATMLAGEGTAPGRAIPGQKARSEKPIPADRTRPAKQPVRADSVRSSSTKNK